jgi:hypothetical protein
MRRAVTAISLLLLWSSASVRCSATIPKSSTLRLRDIRDRDGKEWRNPSCP